MDFPREMRILILSSICCEDIFCFILVFALIFYRKIERDTERERNVWTQWFYVIFTKWYISFMILENKNSKFFEILFFRHLGVSTCINDQRVDITHAIPVWLLWLFTNMLWGETGGVQDLQ